MSGSGISWAICKSAPRSRQITTPAPHHSFFTGRMPFLPPNQQRQSTEGNKYVNRLSGEIREAICDALYWSHMIYFVQSQYIYSINQSVSRCNFATDCIRSRSAVAANSWIMQQNPQSNSWPRGSPVRQRTGERTRWCVPLWRSYSEHCRSLSGPDTAAETASPDIGNNLTT